MKEHRIQKRGAVTEPNVIYKSMQKVLVFLAQTGILAAYPGHILKNLPLETRRNFPGSGTAAMVAA